MARQQQQGTIDKATQFGGMLGGAYAMMKDLEKDTFKRGQDYLVGAEMYKTQKSEALYKDKMREVWDTMLAAWDKAPDDTPIIDDNKDTKDSYKKIFDVTPDTRDAGGYPDNDSMYETPKPEVTWGPYPPPLVSSREEAMKDVDPEVKKEAWETAYGTPPKDGEPVVSFWDALFSSPQEEKDYSSSKPFDMRYLTERTGMLNENISQLDSVITALSGGAEEDSAMNDLNIQTGLLRDLNDERYNWMWGNE